jgi:hypothetical protein
MWALISLLSIVAGNFRPHTQHVFAALAAIVKKAEETMHSPVRRLRASGRAGRARRVRATETLNEVRYTSSPRCATIGRLHAHFQDALKAALQTPLTLVFSPSF